jgi:TetR/AcrR family transcriptional regulator, regulator of autoinduction and epiphytic fitness
VADTSSVRSARAAGAPLSFRDRQFRLREEAILDAANQLLAQRGYELMSMDELAAAVGIAKGSLYKHFASKEQLAAASMTRLLRRIGAQLQAQPSQDSPRRRLEELLRWALRERAASRMPLLPSTNPSLQQALTETHDYSDALTDVGNALAELVVEGVERGELRSDLPVPVLLFTVYARSCDPSFDFLRASGEFSDEQVIEFMVASCFDGLAAARPAPAMHQ